MIERPLSELVDAGWADALAPVAPVVRELGERLGAEAAAGRPFLPAPEHVLRAFGQPLDDVRVLIVGQDPYPTPGHAIGLSFAVERHVRPLPRSLQNIYRELRDDLGIAPAAHGDLSAWSAQGVLLLNRVLTVQAGVTDSHRGWGWEQVTEAAIRALVARRRLDGGTVPLVAILWGAKAQALAPLLEGVPVIASAHPSPLSASRGFFGSRPFSRANAELERQGAAPIDWRIPTDGGEDGGRSAPALGETGRSAAHDAPGDFATGGSAAHDASGLTDTGRSAAHQHPGATDAGRRPVPDASATPTLFDGLD